LTTLRLSSTLINDTPLDTKELFSAYDDTLRSLLEKHAPFRRVRHSVRPSPVSYDAECRATRRFTRKLERVYRRSLTVESCAAWKTQFNDQRQLFHRKATSYWSTALLDCSNDPKALWAKLQQLSQPPTTQQVQHTATDLMTHFVGKVQKIHASTAGADAVSTVKQSDVELSMFQPVTSDHMFSNLTEKSKHCPLDPAAT